eukprot:scaffold7675_cov162-Skeletonema_menzelii.AAC.1
MRRDVCWVSEKDLAKLRFIRRASLDVMWSRQTSTVHANFARMRRDVREATEVMTMGHIFPRMGNPDMEDKCGMEIATIMLQASLRRGMYASHLQFDTTRKTVLWAMNAWSAVMRGEDGTLFASDDRTLFSSESPTRSRWFQRFVLGMKRRMGVIRKQDEALTSAQILALQEVGEWMWERAEGAAERKEIANIMAFVVIGFCASLRGEEISLVSMRGLLAFWQDTIQKGFIMVTLRGRARMRDYNDTFQQYIRLAMDRSPSTFSSKSEAEDFNLRRSLRRGSTTQSHNNKTPPATIELMNRWRKREAARGAEPGLEMRQ